MSPLIPADIPPVGSVSRYIKTGGARGDDHKQKQSVDAGQNAQTDRKPADIGKEPGQRFPDMLRRLGIAFTGGVRLFAQLHEMFIQRIGTGGGVALFGNHSNDRAAHIYPWEQGVFTYILFDPLDKEERGGKCADGCKQLPQGDAPLHAGEHLGRNVQLHQLERGFQRSGCDAAHKDAPAVFPGKFHHPLNILQDVVF